MEFRATQVPVYGGIISAQYENFSFNVTEHKNGELRENIFFCLIFIYLHYSILLTLPWSLTFSPHFVSQHFCFIVVFTLFFKNLISQDIFQVHCQAILFLWRSQMVMCSDIFPCIFFLLLFHIIDSYHLFHPRLNS